MQQTAPSPTPIPTEFSPEFTAWIDQEKRAAKRYRARALKMTLAVLLIGAALVMLKDQPTWVQQIVEAASQVKP